MRPTINIFVISDTHFNHWNINQYCSRGFKTLEEMNDTMIKRWNSLVKKEDIVIHVGDIIFTRGKSSDIIKILKALNGRIIVVRGNHDRKPYSWYLSNNVTAIAEKMYWRFNKTKILFVHKPQDITTSDIRNNDFIIHGHTHNKGTILHKRGKCRLINVSVEQINYTPINLVTLLNQIRQGYYDRTRQKKA